MNKKRNRKIFIIINLIVILGILGFYAYRCVHYYKLEHPKVEEKETISNRIIADNGIAFTGNGLYKDNNLYYFKGTKVNNYVWYSGLLWQVISINNNETKLITSDSVTSLVWSIDNNYETSYIRNWLNSTDKKNSGIFQNNLSDLETIVKKTDYCYDEVTIDNLTCNKKVNDYVGLLTIDEYMLSGSNNSYLNNGTYFWTNNTASDNKVWYIFNEGGINNESHNEINYYSYGVRPVITLNSDVTVYSGKGTKENPYIIEFSENTLVNSKSVGDYIKYSNSLWRIASQEEDYTAIVLDGYIIENEKELLMSYSTKTTPYSTTIILGKYLNGTFLNTLNKDLLVKGKTYIGEYNETTSYDYKNIYTKNIESYVGLLNVGSMFTNDYSNYWLSTSVINNKQLVYTIKSTGGLFSDLVTSNNKIRPVVYLKQNLITLSGTGLKTDPYIIEEV